MTYQDLLALGFQTTPDGRLFMPYEQTTSARDSSLPGGWSYTRNADGSYTASKESSARHGEDSVTETRDFGSLQEMLQALGDQNQFDVAISGGQNVLRPGTADSASLGTFGDATGYFLDPRALSIAGVNAPTGSGWNEYREGFAKPVALSILGSTFLNGAGAEGIAGGTGSETLVGSAGGDTLGSGLTLGGSTGEAAGGGALASGGSAAGGGGAGAAAGGGGLSIDTALKAAPLLLALASSGKNQSTGTTSTTTTSANSPWGAQQPYLESLFREASNLYANPSSADQEYLRRLREPRPLVAAGQNEFAKTIAGDYLRPESNPYLQGTLNNLFGDVQSRVAGTFGTKGGNNYGSSAHQEWLGRALTEAASPLLNQNYQAERSRQLNAAQLAPSMAYADLAPVKEAAAYPWERLSRLQGAISGNYGGTSNSETVSPYFKPNPYLNALGAGIAGLGLYNMGSQSGLWGSGMSGTGGTNYAGTTSLGSGLNTANSGWGYGWGTT